ncbi:hypothetical protein M422DRAFT_244783 [Sphaerobolus stellatus SS14]|nr:hypothetical protein M422DRAFT_244783 [Sphaerobolus stellatus SS14]
MARRDYQRKEGSQLSSPRPTIAFKLDMLSLKLELTVFPLNDGNIPFEERMEIIRALFGSSGTHTCAEVQIAKQIKIKQKEHIFKMFKSIESKGSEGVMLREPGSFYERRRTKEQYTMLNVKTFYDVEAERTVQ